MGHAERLLGVWQCVWSVCPCAAAFSTHCRAFQSVLGVLSVSGGLGSVWGNCSVPMEHLCMPQTHGEALENVPCSYCRCRNGPYSKDSVLLRACGCLPFQGHSRTLSNSPQAFRTIQKCSRSACAAFRPALGRLEAEQCYIGISSMYCRF